MRITTIAITLSYNTFVLTLWLYTNWWAMTGSNRRHPACKAGALPAELITRGLTIISIHKKIQCVKAFIYFCICKLIPSISELICGYLFLLCNVLNANRSRVFSV